MGDAIVARVGLKIEFNVAVALPAYHPTTHQMCNGLPAVALGPPVPPLRVIEGQMTVL